MSMTITIAQASERTGLSSHTLRYYDKEGLLPFVDRTPAGVRMFKESDFEWLAMINCLKKSGMPIKEIRQFIDWCLEGDSTIEKRLNIFLEHKKAIEEKMDELQQYMETINYKISYYTKAMNAGTEALLDTTCAMENNICTSAED